MKEGISERENHWTEYKRALEKIPVTETDLDTYLEFFQLTEKELENKNILDVCAGTRKFARDIEAKGISAKVFSADPLYGLSEEEVKATTEKTDERMRNSFGIDRYRGDIARVLQEANHGLSKDKSVAAFAEMLPFKNESFDLVLCSYGLPMYGTSAKQVAEFFKEVDRITKWDGGEIRIYPLTSRDDKAYKEANKLVSIMRDAKEYDIKLVPIKAEGKWEHVSRLDMRELVCPLLLIIKKNKRPKNIHTILASILERFGRIFQKQPGQIE